MLWPKHFQHQNLLNKNLLHKHENDPNMAKGYKLSTVSTDCRFLVESCPGKASAAYGGSAPLKAYVTVSRKLFV